MEICEVTLDMRAPEETYTGAEGDIYWFSFFGGGVGGGGQVYIANYDINS